MKRIEYYNLSELVEKLPYENFSFTTWAGAIITSPFTSTQKGEFDSLFANYIFPRFFGYTCIRQENEFMSPYTGIQVEKKKEFIIHMYSIFQNTYARYHALISLYNDNIANLMNKVESESISRFNDTPQDSGEFDDDSHTTHITQGKQSTDLNTPIERLDEIRRKLANVEKEWSDEFQGLFYEVSL